MKKQLLLISLFLLISNVSYADNYLVEKPDGSVAIIAYQEDSTDSLETIVNQLGFKGYPISRLDTSTLPPRADRKYWKKNPVPIGSKVIVDTLKKQADETDQTLKEERKRALFKMTPTEYQEAKDMGLIR